MYIKTNNGSLSVHGKTSKACFGAAGIRCTIHHLNCVDGTIAISEAYYTDNTQCGGGLSSCSVNDSNITETGNHKEFNASEWDILQRNCSSKSTCEFKAGRKPMGFFSVVKYNCIQNGVSTNGHVTDTTQHTGHLETTTVSEKEKETTAVISTAKVRSSSLTSPYASNTEITALTANNSFPGGIFMAGFGTGVMTVAAIVLVVYVVIIKRRCDITAKKQDGVPASMEHPTYSDLSTRHPANTYKALSPDVATYANDSITVDESSREYENA